MTSGSAFGVSIAIGGILLWAGLHKLQAPRQFIAGVHRYRVLPSVLVAPVAVAVLVGELGVGVLLVSYLAPAVAALAATCLFALFATAHAMSLARGTDARCFCFGADQAEPISWVTLLRTTFLLFVSACVVALSLAVDGQAPLLHDVPASLTLAAAVVVTTRLISGIPYAVAAFRMNPVISPTRTPRLSFRGESLDFSLKEAVASRRQLGGGIVDPIGRQHG